MVDASQVTAVLPLFPYSRQSEIPFHKTGAPPFKGCDSTAQTPHPDRSPTAGLSSDIEGVNRGLSKVQIERSNGIANEKQNGRFTSNKSATPKRSNTMNSTHSESSTRQRDLSTNSMSNGVSHEESGQNSTTQGRGTSFQPRPGYKQWVAQSGTLVADLITSAGADHVITMDLHDPQYQGFLDIPVDNLYARPILKRYIESSIPNYQRAIVVSPDAGGAKRASAIADGLGMSLGLIHRVQYAMQVQMDRLIMPSRCEDPSRSQIARLRL